MMIRLESIGRDAKDEHGNSVDMSTLRPKGSILLNGEANRESIVKSDSQATHYYLSGNQIIFYNQRTS